MDTIPEETTLWDMRLLKYRLIPTYATTAFLCQVTNSKNTGQVSRKLDTSFASLSASIIVWVLALLLLHSDEIVVNYKIIKDNDESL